jgi:serine/threonine-protein kinase
LRCGIPAVIVGMDNIAETAPNTGDAGGPDLSGQTLGDFHILRKLGQGGMGQVYLAEQVSLKRNVALKLLKPELAANQTALKRFKAEAEAVARATHANIVQVYAIGEWQGTHYMALEYVEGRNLRDFVAKKGPPELLLALSIMRQCAAALQRASELGIIHRDIKPENILLTRKGEVKVADFGLSRVLEGERPAVNLTQSGVTMGTPLYMSPEQVEGKPVDPRTDIYSLGITCFHMFAGEPPFKGSTAFEVALQHVRQAPPQLWSIRTDLPPEVCAVVHKMMAKNPEERYQSGKELLKDIARLRESMTGQTGYLPLTGTGPVEQHAAPTLVPMQTPVSMVTRPPRPTNRRRLVLVLFVMSVLTAGAAGGFLGWLHQRNKSPGSEEERTSIEPAPATEATSLHKREQALKSLIDEHLDPAGNYKNPTRGAELCLDYAIPLFEQGRLDEAEELFRRLEAIARIDLYHVLGLMGKGVVLSLRDKWEVSNQTFQSIRPKKLTDEERIRSIGVLTRAHPQFRRWLSDAVHRNVVNSNGTLKEKDMPQFLRQFVRKPSGPGDRGPSKERKD